MQKRHVFDLHLTAPRLFLLLPSTAGKDVLQRVGSKGAVADLTRVLVARLTPALLPPEVLHAAMEEAEGSQEGGRVLLGLGDGNRWHVGRRPCLRCTNALISAGAMQRT